VRIDENLRARVPGQVLRESVTVRHPRWSGSTNTTAFRSASSTSSEDTPGATRQGVTQS
jgi:hypothetical protein